MLKSGRLRVHWVASFGVALVLCVYFGVGYYDLRSVDHHLRLVTHSIDPNLGWFGERVVEFELRRRIENGDFAGADVLFDTLAMGLARDDWMEPALRRAEWLVADLVDVNAEGESGLTPLHRAVALNDPAIADQLIRLGGDPGVRASVGGPEIGAIDALDYAKMVRAVSPDEDMSAIFQVLESAMETR